MYKNKFESNPGSETNHQTWSFKYVKYILLMFRSVFDNIEKVEKRLSETDNRLSKQIATLVCDFQSLYQLVLSLLGKT